MVLLKWVAGGAMIGLAGTCRLAAQGGAGVEFSVEHGLFEEPITLGLSSGTPDAVIRFTTNGAAPTLTSGSIYTGPFPIVRTTVVRAAAFKAGDEPSPVATRTYLFLEDVIRQSPNGAAPLGWPSAPVNGQRFDFGMDPDIVNGNEGAVKAALRAVPTVSLVTDLSHLVSAASGIYVNASEHGAGWERPVSVEFINDPFDARGFQENAGLRIRGNFSRADENPKHAFRVFFRSELGASKLNYRLFGWEGAEEFDGFDIQCPQDFSWSYLGDSRNNFLREVWFRDTQRDQKQPHARGRFVHLYLNGIYWGLYQAEERTEASFAETYLGGIKEDYDVIKTTGQSGGYTIEATDGELVGSGGSLSAYQSYWQQSRALFADATNARYFAMQGLAADGLTPSAEPVLLDPDNLIDYMLVVFFGGNADGPLSDVLGNDTPNNYFCLRSRTARRGFSYYFHDAEMSLDFMDVSYDRTGPFINGGSNDFTRSNPQYTHQDLQPNAEYRVRFGDRAHRSLFNDGALTTAAVLARLDARAQVVAAAIPGESARWGDAQRPSEPFTVTDWQAARDESRNWLAARHPVVLGQLKNQGLYPDVIAPRFNHHGGEISPATGILMLEAIVPVYYTRDGSDPRRPGGAINPSAERLDPVTTTALPLIVHPSLWRYLDNGSAAPEGWQNIVFDDASWRAGNSELGYGDGDETTVVRFGEGPDPDPDAKWITTYFRRRFFINDLSDLVGLRLELKYDDGAVIYLNGVEVERPNMPPLPAVITASTPAVIPLGQPEEDQIAVFELDPARLVAGPNMLAIEIHQSSGSSSDISLLARLEATRVTGSSPLTFPAPAIQTLKARARDAAGNWSALTAAEFLVGVARAAPGNLVVSEVFYHPPHSSFTEFIELQNVSAAAVDLRGARFVEGIRFAFPDSTPLLPPQGRLILVRSRAVFEARYGPSNFVGGQFEGSLDNGGERLVLLDAHNSVLADFSYAPREPWPVSADSSGHSLVLKSPTTPASPDSWRSSVAVGGNPGGSDATRYDAWKQSHAIVDDAEDADFDGLPAIMEYALGGDPALPVRVPVPEIAFGAPAPGSAGTSFVEVEARCRLGADDVVVRLEQSPDLGSWSDVPLVLHGEVNHGDGTASLSYESAQPGPRTERGFWRVRFQIR